MNNYLQHHGILGMKWGVRRFQNKDGSYTDAGRKRYGYDPANGDFIVKKKTTIYRVSNNLEDKTYDNKKYVSLSQKDHREWQKYIGDVYNRNGQAYNIMYTPVKDLKIASYTKVGKIWIDKQLEDPNFKNKSISDTIYASKQLNYSSEDANDMLALNFAMQTETGKAIVKELMRQGYQGVQDRHGQNTADNPVIIFDPDKNMKRSSATVYKPKKIY